LKLTLNKYIFHEIWPTFLATLFICIFLILATRMLSIMELLVNQGVRVQYVVRMIVYLLPDIVAFALPAASLVSVVVAFLRLSADNEIIALKACGVSLYQLLPPVFLVSIMGLFLSAAIGMFAVPWGNRSFKDLIFQIAQSKADLGIKEQVFCEPFDDVVFYVNSFSSRERIMKDIFVVDRRDKSVKNTIVAERGQIFSYPEKRLIALHFFNGTIFVVGKDLKSARSIGFQTYNMSIGLKDIMEALASRRKKPKEMTVRELIGQLQEYEKGQKKYNNVMIDLLEKFSIPIAVFLMGMIGAPLGAQLRARGRTAGIGLGLAVFMIYYMCLAGMRSVCETGTIPPEIGVWIPDVFLLVAMLYLLRRVANERPVRLRIPALLRRWKTRQPI